jgi:hypothetical protein
MAVTAASAPPNRIRTVEELAAFVEELRASVAQAQALRIRRKAA